MSIIYAHHLNKDNVPFYVESVSGLAHWLLPQKSNLKNCVRIVSHLSDENEVYYEDTVTQETHWTLPKGTLSTAAVNMMERLRTMSTLQCERYLNQDYDAKASNALQARLDASLEGEEEEEEEEEVVVQQAAPAKAASVLASAPLPAPAPNPAPTPAAVAVYVHHLNKDSAAFYVDVNTGIASWLLPPRINLKTSVRILSHLTDEGELFYEDTLTKKTVWAMPAGLLSASAVNMLERLRGMNTTQCERYLNQDFDAKASAALQESLDAAMSDTEYASEDEEAVVPKASAAAGAVGLTSSNGKVTAVTEASVQKKKSVGDANTWKYIRHLNKDDVPVFIDIHSGIASWLISIPEDIKSTIRIITHVTEEGELYYEDFLIKQTRWALPAGLLSSSASNMADRLRGMNTVQCERYMNEDFDAKASATLQATIDRAIDIDSDDDSSTNPDPVELKAITVHEGPPPTRRESRHISSSYLSKVFGAFDEAIDPIVDLDEVEESVAPKPIPQAVESKPLSIADFENNKQQSGMLNKLAKVSGRNWKGRFFWVTPIALIYFVDEKTAAKGVASKQGDMQLTGDSSVDEEEKVEGQGFSFRVSTPWESMKLAASTIAERASWVKAIRSAIASNQNTLRGYQQRAGTMMSSKKYFILRSNTLSCHPDHSQPGKVEGLVNLNRRTKLTAIDETKCQFTIEDGDYVESKYKFTIIFNKTTSDFQTWLAFIQQQIQGVKEKAAEKPASKLTALSMMTQLSIPDYSSEFSPIPESGRFSESAISTKSDDTVAVISHSAAAAVMSLSGIRAEMQSIPYDMPSPPPTPPAPPGPPPPRASVNGPPGAVPPPPPLRPSVIDVGSPVPPPPPPRPSLIDVSSPAPPPPPPPPPRASVLEGSPSIPPPPPTPPPQSPGGSFSSPSSPMPQSTPEPFPQTPRHQRFQPAAFQLDDDDDEVDENDNKDFSGEEEDPLGSDQDEEMVVEKKVAFVSHKQSLQPLYEEDEEDDSSQGDASQQPSQDGSDAMIPPSPSDSSPTVHSSMFQDALDTGGITLGRIYADNKGKNKPMVRLVFETYCDSNTKMIGPKELQILCYELSCYVPLPLANATVKKYDSHRRGALDYDDFMAWWRMNDKFNSLKFTDVQVQRNNMVSTMFRNIDKTLCGFVSRQDFRILLKNILSKVSMKADPTEVLAIVDSDGSGKVYFSKFIEWFMDASSVKTLSTSSISRMLGLVRGPGKEGARVEVKPVASEPEAEDEMLAKVEVASDDSEELWNGKDLTLESFVPAQRPSLMLSKVEVEELMKQDDVIEEEAPKSRSPSPKKFPGRLRRTQFSATAASKPKSAEAAAVARKPAVSLPSNRTSSTALQLQVDSNTTTANMPFSPDNKRINISPPLEASTSSSNALQRAKARRASKIGGPASPTQSSTASLFRTKSEDEPGWSHPPPKPISLPAADLDLDPATKSTYERLTKELEDIDVVGFDDDFHDQRHDQGSKPSIFGSGFRFDDDDDDDGVDFTEPSRDVKAQAPSNGFGFSSSNAFDSDSDDDGTANQTRSTSMLSASASVEEVKSPDKKYSTPFPPSKSDSSSSAPVSFEPSRPHFARITASFSAASASKSMSLVAKMREAQKLKKSASEASSDSGVSNSAKVEKSELSKTSASIIPPPPGPPVSFKPPAPPAPPTPTATPTAAAVPPPPPPPAAAAVNIADPKYEKYVKMRKMLPEGAVRLKMKQDGFDEKEINSFMTTGGEAPAAPAAPVAPPPPPGPPAAPPKPPAPPMAPPPPPAAAAAVNIADPKYEKYVKMRKMLPEGAVRLKMKQDGFDEKEINSFMTTGGEAPAAPAPPPPPGPPSAPPKPPAPPAAAPPPPPPPPAAAAVNIADPKYEKYVKMRKMLPEGAVRLKMKQDGFDEKEINSFMTTGGEAPAAPAAPVAPPPSPAPPVAPPAAPPKPPGPSASPAPPQAPARADESRPSLPVAAAQTASVTAQGSTSKLERYDKLRKMLPESVVRTKMTQDGFNAKEINDFMATPITEVETVPSTTFSFNTKAIASNPVSSVTASGTTPTPTATRPTFDLPDRVSKKSHGPVAQAATPTAPPLTSAASQGSTKSTISTAPVKAVGAASKTHVGDSGDHVHNVVFSTIQKKPLVPFQPDPSASGGVSTTRLTDFVQVIQKQLDQTDRKLSDENNWHPIGSLESRAETVITPEPIEASAIVPPVESTPVKASGPSHAKPDGDNIYEKFSAYQLLLSKREEIDRALQALVAKEGEALARIQRDEEQSLNRIQAQEAESIRRVEEAEASFKRSADAIREEIEQEELRQAAERERLAKAELAMNQLHRQRTAELTVVASALSKHHVQIVEERRRIARQRFQLDMALQDLNDNNPSMSKGTLQGANPAPSQMQSSRQFYPQSSSPAPPPPPPIQWMPPPMQQQLQYNPYSNPLPPEQRKRASSPSTVSVSSYRPPSSSRTRSDRSPSPTRPFRVSTRNVTTRL